MSSSSSIAGLIDHCGIEPIESRSSCKSNIIFPPKRRKLNNDNISPEITSSRIINVPQKKNEVTVSVHSTFSYLPNQDNSLNTLSSFTQRSTPMGTNHIELQRIMNLSQNPLLSHIQMLPNTTGVVFQQPTLPNTQGINIPVTRPATTTLPNTQGIHIPVTRPAATIMPLMNFNPGINSSFLGQNLSILPPLCPDQFRLNHTKMQVLNDLQQEKFAEQLIFEQALRGPIITTSPFINNLGVSDFEQRIMQEGDQSQQLLLAKSKHASMIFTPRQSKTPTFVNLQNFYAQDENSEESSKHKTKLLYSKLDDNNLSRYQCIVRKQIEVFEAKKEDVSWRKEAYGKEIVLGQIGIQCRHCARIPTRHRTRGATYYPAGLKGLYQAAQNMASIHFSNYCHLIPDDEREHLNFHRKHKISCYRRVKQYWVDGVSVLGIIEINGILRFKEGTDEIKSSKIKKLSKTALGERTEINTKVSSSTRTEKNSASLD